MIIGDKVTNPGDLRTKIALYSRGITTTAGGFQKPSLTKITDVWAKWINVHGSESWIANSVQAKSAATVLIRYDARVDATCVVRKDEVNYEIVSMDDVQNRHEYLELKVQLWQPG